MKEVVDFLHDKNVVVEHSAHIHEYHADSNSH